MASMTKPSLLKDSIISIITVTYNDEGIIASRLRSINKTLSLLETNYEILVVDNNSEDKTVKKIRSLRQQFPQTRVLVLSKKYDIEVALTAGLDNCVGDLAILFNLYTDPTYVKLALVKKLLDGNDLVIGKFTRDVVKRDWISNLLIKLMDKYSAHGFRHPQNYLTGLNRKTINSLTQTRRKSRSLSYLHSLIGFNIANSSQPR